MNLLQKRYWVYAVMMVCVTFFSCLCASAPESFNESAISEDKESKDVVPFLELTGGEAVADLGAGGGYFAVKLAKAVGEKGRVYAIDISSESLVYIKKYCTARGINNVTTVKGTFEESGLKDGSVDMVFIRNTYHDIGDRAAYFSRLKSVLKPGGRVVIIDYDPVKLGAFRKLHGHYLKESMIIDEMKKAGYGVLKRYDMLKQQSFNIFVVQKDS
ncbi:MAG: class I SAM-dependent methyltransferase [bacterium]|nr:class I SAM-dependent methyltransferase [bacterium]